MGNLDELEKFLPLKSEKESMRPFINDSDLQLGLTARCQATDEPHKGFDFQEIYKSAKELKLEKAVSHELSKEMEELSDDFKSMLAISEQLVLAYKELIQLKQEGEITPQEQ